jgi:hypothetical protein
MEEHNAGPTVLRSRMPILCSPTSVLNCVLKLDIAMLQEQD